MGVLKTVSKPWISRIFLHFALLIIFTATVHTIVAPNENLRRYENRWAPAIAAACFGRLGMINLENMSKEAAISAEKKYVAFLTNQHTEPFSCADLPNETQLINFRDGANENLRGFLRNQAGLHLLSGYLFRILGFDWSIVAGLASLFAGLVSLALFMIANRFVSVIPAIALAGGSTLAVANLELITIIRDYAKVPFILFGFLALVRIITEPSVSARTFYTRCAALGLLLGVGLMFRTDLLATFALSMAVLFFFPHSRRPLSMLAAPLAVTLPFLAFYIPSNIVFAIEYDAIGHVINLGLSESALKNAGWSFHDVIFNPFYRDYASYGMIGAYGAAIGNENVIAVNAQYASSGMQLFKETLLTFPFDVIGRCFTIFFDITSAKLIYPFEAGKDGFTYLMAAVSLFFYVYAFARHRRLFYVALFYFFGYACVVSMQYIERHYFFLHMLWFTFVSASVLRFVWEFSGQRLFLRKYLISNVQMQTSIKTGWTLQALLFASVFLIITGAFAVQKQRANAWQKAVLAQPVTPFKASVFPEGTVPGSPAPTSEEDAYVLDLNAPWSDFHGAIRPNLDYAQIPLGAPIGGYIEARFHSKTTCGKPVGRFWAMYTARSYAWNLSHVVHMTFDETHETSHFFPVFFSEPAQFSRLTFNATGSDCLEGLYWVQNFQDLRLPIAFSAARNAK